MRFFLLSLLFWGLIKHENITLTWIELSEAQQASEVFLGYLQNGDYDRAYAMLSGQEKERFESLRKTYQDNPPTNEVVFKSFEISALATFLYSQGYVSSISQGKQHDLEVNFKAVFTNIFNPAGFLTNQCIFQNLNHVNIIDSDLLEFTSIEITLSAARANTDSQEWEINNLGKIINIPSLKLKIEGKKIDSHDPFNNKEPYAAMNTIDASCASREIDGIKKIQDATVALVIKNHRRQRPLKWSEVNKSLEVIEYNETDENHFPIYCSGSTIRSLRDSHVEKLYVLTSLHCLMENRESIPKGALLNLPLELNDSLYILWHFRTRECEESKQNRPAFSYKRFDYRDFPHTSTVKLVAANPESDSALLEVEPPAQAGEFVTLGWTIFFNDTNLHRVSHPFGATRAYTSHRLLSEEVIERENLLHASSQITQKLKENSLDPSYFLFSSTEQGVLRGLSSGSALVNSNFMILGHLQDKVNNVSLGNIRSQIAIDSNLACSWNDFEKYLGELPP
jgi:hypothetical protein